MKFTGTVLLVDDEPHIRKYLTLILRQFGTPVIVEASNGEEAVARFEQDKPDLVLLDVNMPKMDGLAALKRLKEINPDCVVVMLTSLANRETVDQALELGASGYLRKDTPKEEIVTSLGETLAACFDLT